LALVSLVVKTLLERKTRLDLLAAASMPISAGGEA
jgi:hypothetical protein